MLLQESRNLDTKFATLKEWMISKCIQLIQIYTLPETNDLHLKIEVIRSPISGYHFVWCYESWFQFSGSVVQANLRRFMNLFKVVHYTWMSRWKLGLKVRISGLLHK